MRVPVRCPDVRTASASPRRAGAPARYARAVAKPRTTSPKPPSDADPADDVRARVAELLAAGPRQARTVSAALVAQLRATPASRAALPAPADVPEAHRRAIVAAHAAALLAAADGDGLGALVASLDGALAWAVVLGAGNARDFAPYVAVAAAALDRDDPDVRLAAIYGVRRWVAAGGEVAPFAAGLVRAAADDRRGPAMKAKVATAARDALRDAAQRPADRAAIDAAVALAEPPALRRALTKLLGDAPPSPRTVAEAVRALGRDPRLQALGLAHLTSTLVTDMTDVRAAFRFVGDLLASADPAVRDAAAALAYYGADLQGRTAEAQRMRPALAARAAAPDLSDAAREHLAAALRALDRARAAG